MSKNKYLGTYQVYRPKPRAKALKNCEPIQVNKGVYDIAPTREKVMEVVPE